METHTLLLILAYLCMAIGLIGAVVPFIPGPLFIWGGALLWAWTDAFHRVSWTTLTIMAVIGVIAMASDLIATTITGRKAGMSWRTIFAAVVGGLAGGILSSFLPVLGTLLGAIAGALLGVTLAEYAQTHDWSRAWHAARVYVIGFLIGRIFELVLCLLMIAVFVFNIFR